MQRELTLEYWIDDNWYVGKLKEIPSVFSQGETLDELEENIKDVFKLMTEEETSEKYPDIKRKDLTLDVA
jgi:predicted RNase H-like HicB family nuclease